MNESSYFDYEKSQWKCKIIWPKCYFFESLNEPSYNPEPLTDIRQQNKPLSFNACSYLTNTSTSTYAISQLHKPLRQLTTNFRHWSKRNTKWRQTQHVHRSLTLLSMYHEDAYHSPSLSTLSHIRTRYDGKRATLCTDGAVLKVHRAIVYLRNKQRIVSWQVVQTDPTMDTSNTLQTLSYGSYSSLCAWLSVLHGQIVVAVKLSLPLNLKPHPIYRSVTSVHSTGSGYEYNAARPRVASGVTHIKHRSRSNDRYKWIIYHNAARPRVASGVSHIKHRSRSNDRYKWIIYHNAARPRVASGVTHIKHRSRSNDRYKWIIYHNAARPRVASGVSHIKHRSRSNDRYKWIIYHNAARPRVASGVSHIKHRSRSNDRYKWIIYRCNVVT
ncbi:hypothetical protein J6590_086132 [Homalodisca vitripennis]|nr:hypothetical protein J6590_086132 [Homalodisca vitripennis]